MNLLEALHRAEKTGQPLKRATATEWVNVSGLKAVDLEAVRANDWEVKDQVLSVTTSQVENGLKKVVEKLVASKQQATSQNLAEHLLDELTGNK